MLRDFSPPAYGALETSLNVSIGQLDFNSRPWDFSHGLLLSKFIIINDLIMSHFTIHPVPRIGEESLIQSLESYKGAQDKCIKVFLYDLYEECGKSISKFRSEIEPLLSIQPNNDLN